MLHVRGGRVDRRRLASALQVLQARQLLLHAARVAVENAPVGTFMSGPCLACAPRRQARIASGRCIHHCSSPRCLRGIWRDAGPSLL